jgi:hypothetical protein
MTKSTRMLIMDRKIIVRLIEGDSFNLIARELKVGKRRIKRIYTKAFGAGYITLLRPLPPFPEKLFPDKVDITNDIKTRSPYDQILLPFLDDIN